MNAIIDGLLLVKLGYQLTGCDQCSYGNLGASLMAREPPIKTIDIDSQTALHCIQLTGHSYATYRFDFKSKKSS